MKKSQKKFYLNEIVNYEKDLEGDGLIPLPLIQNRASQDLSKAEARNVELLGKFRVRYFQG